MSSEDPAEGDRLGEHFLTAARLAKVDALREAGVDPYPVTFSPTTSAAALQETHGGLAAGEGSGARETVAGRLLALRVAALPRADGGGRRRSRAQTRADGPQRHGDDAAGDSQCDVRLHVAFPSLAAQPQGRRRFLVLLTD